MTTREELYRTISEAIAGIDEIRYIDLWNHNVEFIEQEAAWERPAVFIEFQPIQWHAIESGVEYRAEVGLKLHVVTDWNEERGIGEFWLLEKIHEVLAGMDGETFRDLDIDSSVTNHNHEEIVENIERYTCVGFRKLAH